MWRRETAGREISVLAGRSEIVERNSARDGENSVRKAERRTEKRTTRTCKSTRDTARAPRGEEASKMERSETARLFGSAQRSRPRPHTQLGWSSGSGNSAAFEDGQKKRTKEKYCVIVRCADDTTMKRVDMLCRISLQVKLPPTFKITYFKYMCRALVSTPVFIRVFLLDLSKFRSK